MQEICSILTVSLGIPPPSDRPFMYKYKNKNEKAQSWTGTPREFYKQFIKKNYPPIEVSGRLVNQESCAR